MNNGSTESASTEQPAKGDVGLGCPSCPKALAIELALTALTDSGVTTTMGEGERKTRRVLLERERVVCGLAKNMCTEPNADGSCPMSVAVDEAGSYLSAPLSPAVVEGVLLGDPEAADNGLVIGALDHRYPTGQYL